MKKLKEIENLINSIFYYLIYLFLLLIIIVGCFVIIISIVHTMNTEELEKILLKERLEVIRSIQSYNEDYIQNETLNCYLEGLKSEYILRSRRTK